MTYALALPDGSALGSLVHRGRAACYVDMVDVHGTPLFRIDLGDGGVQGFARTDVYTRRPDGTAAPVRVGEVRANLFSFRPKYELFTTADTLADPFGRLTVRPIGDTLTVHGRMKEKLAEIQSAPLTYAADPASGDRKKKFSWDTRRTFLKFEPVGGVERAVVIALAFLLDCTYTALTRLYVYIGRQR